MPYTMAIYPNEDTPIPQEGDTFRVVCVDHDVLDMHWGRCMAVVLEPCEDSRTQAAEED